MSDGYRGGAEPARCDLVVEHPEANTYEVSAGERRIAVTARPVDSFTLLLEADGDTCTAHVVRQGDGVQVFLRGAVYRFDSAAEDDAAAAHGLQTPRVTAPMPRHSAARRANR